MTPTKRSEMLQVETNEQRRLSDEREKGIPWKKWGPYLSERQWGTVREDYSQDGNAWNYFTHDQARSRAYRWGEDGLAGVSDNHQVLCFALALWNGRDPILKERLFGLTGPEGNHGCVSVSVVERRAHSSPSPCGRGLGGGGTPSTPPIGPFPPTPPRRSLL